MFKFWKGKKMSDATDGPFKFIKGGGVEFPDARCVFWPSQQEKDAAWTATELNSAYRLGREDEKREQVSKAKACLLPGSLPIFGGPYDGKRTGDHDVFFDTCNCYSGTRPDRFIIKETIYERMKVDGLDSLVYRARGMDVLEAMYGTTATLPASSYVPAPKPAPKFKIGDRVKVPEGVGAVTSYAPNNSDGTGRYWVKVDNVRTPSLYREDEMSPEPPTVTRRFIGGPKDGQTAELYPHVTDWYSIDNFNKPAYKLGSVNGEQMMVYERGSK